MPNSTNKTIVLIVILTLVAGLGIGWILRDLTLPAAQSASVPSSIPIDVSTPTATWVDPTVPATMTLTATQEPYPTPTASAIPTPTWTAVPTLEPPTVTPTAVDPAQAQISSYAAFTVQQGQDLALIAELGGSDAALIAQYNRLVGPPQPGQALIIPQLAGRTSQLQNPPTLIERGPSTQPWVALTLDAGASSAPTPAMLDALRSRGIQITFFLTGKWIRENPDLTRQIVADGHEIANHTTNHPDLRKLDDAAIRQELDDTEAALREAAGVSSKPFFRPPFGAYDKRVLRVVQANGYLPIYWTLDSLDSVGEPKTAEFLLERVTAKLTPEELRGAIILAHCGNQSTADALPAILDRFSAMGFEVHTLSEVLSATRRGP